MIGLLFNSVYTIVDGIFTGNRLGRDAMAAAAVPVPLLEILTSLAIAVASGAGVIIALRLSQGEMPGARRTLSTAFWMVAVTGMAIAIGGNVFLRPLVTLLGAAPNIPEDAAAYFWYIATFAPFQLFSFLLGAWSAMTGGPGWPCLP